MTDESQLLMLPLRLCTQMRLLGGTAMAYKALAVLESAREPRQARVTMPVAALAAAIGSKNEQLVPILRRMAEIECAVPAIDPDTGEEFWDGYAMVDASMTDIGKGRGAHVSVSTTTLWRESCDSERTVPIPLDEVRAMTTRAGIITRLRLGALLHGKEVAAEPRLRIKTSDFHRYTGYSGEASPAHEYAKMLAPGLEEINSLCTTVSVRGALGHRNGSAAHPWLRHVDLRVTPLTRRARSWHVLQDARAAELAD